jgi:hypothetical protein
MPETQPPFKDTSSPYNYNIRQEQLVREYQVALENMQIVRERLAHCVRTEGVNQFVKCKELREQYLALCTDRFKGMIFPPDAQPLNRTTPGLLTGKPAEF